MKENKPLVIVLSRNYSTGLSVIRSVGAAGYTVDLVASAHKAGTSAIAAASKFVRNSTEVVSEKVKAGGDDALLEALLKYAGQNEQKPVLFPTDDYTTSMMDMNRTVLEKHFVMPTIVGGGDGCLTKCMDKTLQAEMAQKAGLLVPKEWILSLDGKIVIPRDMVYPCFCKPIESVTGYKREMARCEDREQLMQHLLKLQSAFPHRSILVQEFLEIDKEIDLSGVCLDQQIIIPAIIRKWNVAKFERGVTLAGKIVPFEELGELQEKVVNLLRQFHYVGMFDMELNIVGDKIYFNEVNLRSGGPNFAYYMSGVNLPALFVKEATGIRHTPEEEKVTKYGQSFVYEKVAWEDYMHGFMTKRELEDRLEAADFTLLNYPDDPEPCKLFMKEMKHSLRYVRLRKIKQDLKRTLNNWKRDLYKVLFPAIQNLRKVKYAIMGYPQAQRENRRNPFAEKARVLVAGRNYCSNLCMARSLGQAGYEVEILRVFQTKPRFYQLMRKLRPDAYSKFIKAYYVCVSYRNSKRILKKLIQIADPYRKMLLIPADDLVANVADEFYDELSQYYLMPNVDNKQGQISHLMSKEVQKELALAAGLPVVNSCVIRSYGGRFTIPKSVTYPCFVKPNISKNSSKSRMRRCDNEHELRATLEAYSENKDIEMLVEDYLDIQKEYAILGLSTKNGVVAPGYFVAEEGGHDAHRGVAMTGRILPCSEEQKLIDDIVKFVASLNFDGLFDVDLIRTGEGKMYFTELNLRFGASGYAVTESGVNLPGMFADYMLLNKPIDLNCKVEPGKHFVSERILIDEYITGYLTKEDMEKHMQSADIHFIRNAQDMAAYEHFQKFFPAATLLKGLQAFKKK